MAYLYRHLSAKISQRQRDKNFCRHFIFSPKNVWLNMIEYFDEFYRPHEENTFLKVFWKFSESFVEQFLCEKITQWQKSVNVVWPLRYLGWKVTIFRSESAANSNYSLL